MGDFKQLEAPSGWMARFFTNLSRILISIFIPAVTFLVLWAGFLFLKSGNTSKAVITLVAIVWGVGGVAALYIVTNWFIQRLPRMWAKRLTPFLFVGPALVILGWYLALPTVRSLYLGFFDRLSLKFVGLDNYFYVVLDSTMRTAFINNLVWLLAGTSFCVVMGLTIAILADRSSYERIAKALIFMPMAISFIGAGIIWKFVYAYRPSGEVQIGLLNAIFAFFGRDPVNFIVTRGWNTIFLIFIFVWLQTGFNMVILSAAIKNVPSEIMEAGRIDGAGEIRIIFSIIIPTIKSTIVTVSTTTLLLTLKIFDIVYGMTNGLYGTEVLASQQYKQMFKFLHYGRGSAIAIVILIAVTPVIWYNLKQFSQREVF